MKSKVLELCRGVLLPGVNENRCPSLTWLTRTVPPGDALFELMIADTIWPN